MDWWQIVLIILFSIVTGLLIGSLLSYLIARILKRPFLQKREATAAFEEPLKSTMPELVAEVESNRIMQLIKRPFLKRRETIEQQAEERAKREAEEARRNREAEEQARKQAEQQAEEQAKRDSEEVRRAREAEGQARKQTPVVEEQLKPVAPDLVAEVENNHKIATESWTDKLLPFQTSVWDGSQDKVHSLPVNVREELTQAYVDMRLANGIVWLSMDLGRRSQNLDEKYRELCTNIAARIDRVTPMLKRPND